MGKKRDEEVSQDIVLQLQPRTTGKRKQTNLDYFGLLSFPSSTQRVDDKLTVTLSQLDDGWEPHWPDEEAKSWQQLNVSTAT